ncbi:MAG: chemotaxis protein CheR [Bdellovibrionales bacterium RIFOXYD12_FULL_39_22]|nr:MAG: chemotaxis protein CheR [Bdellovibrionales bacterium RIFOXYB1_FULL_39_21]OFZ43479.1 MAG: chemotaxis protein CheR [Bdellovibrionales bacterium RIFOXYC12_FULL_39_17]OFZ47022.1 MAG: chemotaxis protein CheR [Bdellovibrionales bacterium RIFOXYC1_FULL_39_130]OFZ71300.1 MAG: chemotaxis protein CheR [Bdellovibrionales bacterium RIFOXYC2_FULL_39_8]OFZ76219.1 MAG: chemotaxis protein CheR [Bdellovibrionales bacterium RIFOXYD1_FULL_39_84]OFZ94454.1 MAG: chemotaxis protein CheR [Bdellovibrionales b
MEQRVFQEFQKLIYAKSGIVLREGKESLVAARVSRRLRETGIENYKQYLQFLESDLTGDELVHLLDAISTNVTHFFREEDHFVFLEKILDNWHAAGQRKFRIWSAASSSGEEPYTIGMVCSKALNVQLVDLKILATDISTKVLGRAVQGVYSADAAKTIPRIFQNGRYFNSCKDDPSCFEIADSVKKLVSFARLNLSSPPFPMQGPFDIIFCRNVMIYFDHEVRARLIREFEKLIRSGGFLITGHSESLNGINSNFVAISPSVYQKVAR